MTCVTIGRRALIYAVGMTGRAQNSRMPACQWEGGIFVVEGHITPGGGFVA